LRETRALAGDPRLILESLSAGLSLTMSMVVDEAGGTVNDIGTSAGIGNATDLLLLKALRRNSDVVLTSGATFRADEYRFPKTADLAVLSHSRPAMEAPEGRRLHWLQSGYREAIEDLWVEGYRHIQVEYGLSGMRELQIARVPILLFVSSVSAEGIDAFLLKQGLTGKVVRVSDLFLAVVAWQEEAKI
jgi:hypothetical protein